MSSPSSSSSSSSSSSLSSSSMGKGKIDYGGMLQKYLESREKSGNVEPSSQSGTDAEVVSIIQASKQIMGKRTTNESAPQPTGATTDTQNVSNGEYRIAEVENNPNRIKVKMSSGTAFECDRFCPHKGADLLQASIRDGFLVCPKHKWSFRLDSGGQCTRNSCTLNSIAIDF